MTSKPSQKSSLRFSILKTADNTTLEGLTRAGGSLLKRSRINYVAFLIEHPKGSFLFDTGLGEQIGRQYSKEMPTWKKPFLAYHNLVPAKQQLDRTGIPLPTRIFLSHAHWDHASALVDFLDSEVWLTNEERQYVSRISNEPWWLRGAAMSSQVSNDKIKWHTYSFSNASFMGFEASFDIFGDGTAVIVPLYGHTPGSVGLFLTVDGDRQYFLCGDTVWNSKAIKTGQPKPVLGRIIADSDHAKTGEAIAKLQYLKRHYPKLSIIPSHDADMQDGLGYFPHSVQK